MDKKILVVGSLNMDLVIQTYNFPQKGETLIGKAFNQIPGGKGANQALAVGRLGGKVDLIGACGRDDYGQRLLSNLEKGGVGVKNIFRLDDESTGIANIIVEEDGNNRIILIQGANAKLTFEMIEKIEDEVKEAEIILLQLEIPLNTVIHTIELAKKHNCKVILDPAPAQNLPEVIYNKIDYLLPNEQELNSLLKDYNLNTEQEQVEQLLRWGVGSVIVTKGEKGISFYQKNIRKDFKTVKVKAIDTTAAGDTFAGALAFGLSKDWTEEQAIKYANLVAAISTTKLGAQSSLPDIHEVEEFIKNMT